MSFRLSWNHRAGQRSICPIFRDACHCSAADQPLLKKSPPADLLPAERRRDEMESSIAPSDHFVEQSLRRCSEQNRRQFPESCAARGRYAERTEVSVRLPPHRLERSFFALLILETPGDVPRCRRRRSENLPPSCFQISGSGFKVNLGSPGCRIAARCIGPGFREQYPAFTPPSYAAGVRTISAPTQAAAHALQAHGLGHGEDELVALTAAT